MVLVCGPSTRWSLTTLVLLLVVYIRLNIDIRFILFSKENYKYGTQFCEWTVECGHRRLARLEEAST